METNQINRISEIIKRISVRILER